MPRNTLTLCLIALLGACQSQEKSDADHASVSPSSRSRTVDLETAYVIAPDAVREMGYRIDWQADVMPMDGSGLRQVAAQHDAVLALDGENFLTRIRRSDGKRLWRLPVASPQDEILGTLYVPQIDRLFLLQLGSVLALEAESGSAVARQDLEKAASTAPAQFGEFLVYGTRDGQVIWHSYLVKFQARAYQVAESILLTPVIADDRLVVIGNDDASRSSRIMVIEPDSASQRWNKPLLDEVVASPTIARGIVYVASTDQYLYAFDLSSGRTLWRRLTTAPLVDPPIVIGDDLYQQIPGEGLTCFDAFPPDSPDGVTKWVCPDVTGTVLFKHRDRLFVWNAGTRKLDIVSAGRGSLIGTLALPQVDGFEAAELESGHLLATSRDGRILRLKPR